MWYFVVFQPSKCKKTHFQPQIWSIWPIFPKDSESLPKFCYIKRKNSEILSKLRNSEPVEVSVLELLTKLLDSSHSWFTGGLLRGMWASQGSVQGLSISSIFLRGSPQLPLAGGHRKGVASLLKPWFQHPQGYLWSICFLNWRKAAQSDCFGPRSSTFLNLTTAYSSFATSATLHSQGMTSWWS